MPKMIDSFKKWKIDVSSQIMKFKRELDKNESSKELYFGFRALYSRIKFKPMFLFIGINPGAGHDQEGEINLSEHDSAFFDVNYGWGDNYALVKDTKEVFNKAGVLDLFKDSHVVTNYFYILTKNERDIYNCTSLVNSDVANTFMEKSAEWTGRLIDIISPKIIICQGKSAYNKVISLDKFNNAGKAHDKWELKGCGYHTFKTSSIIVLGYKRRYSNIAADKNTLARMLKKIVATSILSTEK